MPRVYVSRLAAVVVCLWLLGGVLAGGAWAQPLPPNVPVPVPATLRLAQVVPRLPTLHLFVLAQTETGAPIRKPFGQLEALVGSNPPLEVKDHADEGVAFVFLIDVSGSMKTQLDGIKGMIQEWINSMKPADRAAIATVGTSIHTRVPFTSDRSVLIGEISRLKADEKDTFLYQGIVQAMDLARRLDPNELPLRRAIIMVTDSVDDQQGGAGRQQAEDAMSIDPIPIYGIGVSNRSVAVDTALKDFSALVYKSGGAYQRVEVLPRSLPNLTQAYVELHDKFANTYHFTTDCGPCNPDGSPVEVRLRLTQKTAQGTAQVSSGSVKVLSVAGDGKPAKPPDPGTPSKPIKTSDPNTNPQKTLPWWQSTLDAIASLGWQWLTLCALVLAAVIAGIIAIFVQKRQPSFETTRIIPPVTPTGPASNNDNVMYFAPDVSIRPGTEKHKQRLRLTPLGSNDLPAEEAIFEGDLSVGRSPDNKVHIYNDTQVSSKHCTLSPKDGRILVTDEGSRNGTRVNGVPIEGFIHAEPDSILGVGRTEMRMQLLAPGRL